MANTALGVASVKLKGYPPSHHHTATTNRENRKQLKTTLSVNEKTKKKVTISEIEINQ